MLNITMDIDITMNVYLPDDIIFQTINKFNNLTKFIVKDNSGTRLLQHDSFSGHHQGLKELFITESIKELPSFVFRNLSGLQSLILDGNDIQFIQNNAFVIDTKSQDRLFINLYGNLHLNETAFGDDALTGIKRPATIQLQNNFVYLPQVQFMKFFNDHPDNKLEIWTESKNKFDCQNCKSYWIKQYKLYSRIGKLVCSNGLSLGDADNFKNCP
jgi:hypothetical protein